MVTLSVVTKDITYYAVVTKTPIEVDPIEYDVTFMNEEGELLKVITYE